MNMFLYRWYTRILLSKLATTRKAKFAVEIHIWWWNVAQSLMLLRRGALLFFKVIRQILVLWATITWSQTSTDCRKINSAGVSDLCPVVVGSRRTQVASIICVVIPATEICVSKHRPLATTVHAFCYTCAVAATAGYAYIFRDWRRLQLYIALTGVPLLGVLIM